MDRNEAVIKTASLFRKSLSARRVWIEIPTNDDKACEKQVALRKESVDRNGIVCRNDFRCKSRSPQGECG